MKAGELKALQAPLKDRYREHPGAALVVLKAAGRLADGITCHVDTAHGRVEAGLHPAAGGDGSKVCPSDMLLQALAGCAGVTMNAVATALGIEIRSGTVRVEGDQDFRGTLGVDKETRVGFQAIRLHFDLDTDAPDDQIAKLVRLTERYCVVYQTLRQAPEITVGYRVKAASVE